MPGIYLRKYNVTLDLSTPGSFKIPQSLYKSASSSFAGSGDWTPSAGDVKVSIDGGSEANIGTLPSFSNGAWQYVLSSTELSAHTVHVRTSNAALSDDDFYVETFGNSSAMWPLNYENATNMGMTSLPSVAPGASGGLVVIGTSSNDFQSDSSGRTIIAPQTAGTMTLTTTTTNLTNNTPTAGTITAATLVIDNATSMRNANMVQYGGIPTLVTVGTNSNSGPTHQLPLALQGLPANVYKNWTIQMTSGTGISDNTQIVTASTGTIPVNTLTVGNAWNSGGSPPSAGDTGIMMPPSRSDIMSLNASMSAASALSNASVDGNNHLIVQASGFTSGTNTLTSAIASGTITAGTINLTATTTNLTNNTPTGGTIGLVGGGFTSGTATLASAISAGTITAGTINLSNTTTNLTNNTPTAGTITITQTVQTVSHLDWSGLLNKTATNDLTGTTVNASGGGGGGGFGDGDIAVNQDTGGTDALRVLDNYNNPVDDAIIRAYVQADYAAGLRNVAGSTMTGADGRWQHDLMLSAGNYTLTIDANGFQLDAVNITVS